MARFFKGFHGWSVIFWTVMVPVSIYTGIWRRVEYVTFLSIYALIATHWGAWQASRAEVQVEKTEEIQAHSVNVKNAARVEEKP